MNRKLFKSIKILNKIWPYGLLLFVIILFSTFSYTTPENFNIEVDFSDYTVPESLFIDLDGITIEKKSNRIDSIFDRLHRISGFNGVILYGEKGRLVYKNAFGVGDYRKKIKLTTESVFQLASVSKMFTAMAIMILKEKGRLEFDDTITKFLPDFPYNEVTIRQLLNHRSGLSRYMSLAHEKWTDKTIPLTNTAMIGLFEDHKPWPYFKPGKGFNYCNTNYAVLASIVETISGTTFDRFVKMEIFRPLQMNNSFVYNMNYDTVVSSYIREGVPGYDYRGWRLIRVRNDYLNGVMGDKNIYSTVEDLYKFDQALYEQTLVSDSVMQQAFSKGSPRYSRYKDNYGFGWRIRAREDSCVYHYGWWKGFRSFFIRDMKNQKTVIMLSNRSKGPGSYILWDIIHDESYPLGFSEKIPFMN